MVYYITGHKQYDIIELLEEAVSLCLSGISTISETCRIGLKVPLAVTGHKYMELTHP